MWEMHRITKNLLQLQSKVGKNIDGDCKFAEDLIKMAMLPTSSSIDTSSPPSAIAHSTAMRLASQSAACKMWSIVLTTVVLLFALSKTGSVTLLWSIAPLILFAFMDAAAVVEARRVVGLAWDLSLKDRTDPGKAIDVLRAYVKGPGYPKVLLNMLGIASFRIAPFYLGLASVVAFVGFVQLAPKKNETQELRPIFPTSPNSSFNHFQPPLNPNVAKQFPSKMGAASQSPFSTPRNFNPATPGQSLPKAIRPQGTAVPGPFSRPQSPPSIGNLTAKPMLPPTPTATNPGSIPTTARPPATAASPSQPPSSSDGPKPQ